MEVFMYCPRCKAEYREGISRCADCDVKLVPKLAPEPEETHEYVDWVKIYTFTDRYEADLAQGLLEANDIDAVTSSDDCGSVDPALAFGLGVRLMVKKEDFDKAKEVLIDADYEF
jgi:hypothetical protein